MAEEEEDKSTSSHQFLEVLCNSSGKVRRFAAGTEAGYALYLINRKLEIGIPQAFHIEAVKDGEEPVSFGPNAILVSYGKDWKLQTVIEKGYKEAKQMQQILKKSPNEMVCKLPTSLFRLI
ncbi:uncharacterized protein M6B38_286090 [Iris pallida]|uniref:Uncharacterized protein n=1 Tax=Iris pallida TaxID=29817 RepID=A0AAX6E3W0_IRIPA|nr:Uncharacterized protein M6B38_210345 [Iris pallida]KAJ6845883.1 uncharacterized protein M6B38_286090 [Iris pallida]